jgi:hypothetical protein
VSPLRGGTVRGVVEIVPGRPGRTIPATPGPAEPRLEAIQPASVETLAPEHEPPPLPDEARRAIVAAESSPTEPLQARPGQSLHVRFGLAAQERLVTAFEAVREAIHEHPGDTPVVIHIPSRGGRDERMQLRLGVAYDAELLAAVRRRLGEGLVRLELQ